MISKFISLSLIFANLKLTACYNCMLTQKHNQFFADRRNNILASSSPENLNQAQHNTSSNCDQRGHRSAQEEKDTWPIKSDGRLNLLNKNRSSSQPNDTTNLPSQKKAMNLEGTLNGNIGSNGHSGKKPQNLDAPLPKTQNLHSQQSNPVQSPIFKRNNAERNVANFQEQLPKNEQIQQNMKFIEQTLSNSCFRKRDLSKEQKTSNQSSRHKESKIDFRPAINQLITHFSQPGLKDQHYRELVFHFILCQIHSITGNRCSQLYQADHVQLLDYQRIQSLMKTKMNEAKIIHEIIEQFHAYLSELASSKHFNQDLKLVMHQMWLYFMQIQHQRTQQLLAFCYIYFNCAPNRDRFKTRQQFDNYIVRKIEQINKDLIDFDDNTTDNSFQEQSYREKGKENVRTNGQVFMRSRTFENEVENWRDELKNMNSYKKKNKPSIVILRVNTKIKSPTVQSSIIGPSQIRSYRLNSFKSDQKSTVHNDLQVHYSVYVKWFRNSQQKAPVTTYEVKRCGKAYFSLHFTSEELADLIESQVKEKLCYILRNDAKFQYSRLFQTKQPSIYQIDVTVSQIVLNNPPEYKCQAVWSDKLKVSKLTIKNRYGTAVWNQQLDLQKVDFSLQPFKMHNLTVECNSEQLKKPCLVRFNDLPQNLKKLRKPQKEMFQLFAKFIQTQMNCRLVQVDFEMERFSVEFFNFNRKQRDVQKIVGGYKFQKIK